MLTICFRTKIFLLHEQKLYFFFFNWQAFVERADKLRATQDALYDEVKKEGAKYGDDVQYLAEFTSGTKKFDPWIQKSEAKKAVGMNKPGNLDEAQDTLEETKAKLLGFDNFADLIPIHSRHYNV